MDFRIKDLIAGQKLDWRMVTDFTLPFTHPLTVVQLLSSINIC